MKKYLHLLSVAAGILLLAAGFLMLKIIADPQGILLTLPYVCIGIGSGCFGGGMAEVINKRLMKNDPEFAKQREIDLNDERNVAIGNRAKAKAYDMMVFAFGALMLAFSLMDVEIRVILLLVFCYLFVICYGCYYRFKYDKEM